MIAPTPTQILKGKKTKTIYLKDLGYYSSTPIRMFRPSNGPVSTKTVNETEENRLDHSSQMSD